MGGARPPSPPPTCAGRCTRATRRSRRSSTAAPAPWTRCYHGRCFAPRPLRGAQGPSGGRLLPTADCNPPLTLQGLSFCICLPWRALPAGAAAVAVQQLTDRWGKRSRDALCSARPVCSGGRHGDGAAGHRHPARPGRLAPLRRGPGPSLQASAFGGQLWLISSEVRPFWTAHGIPQGMCSLAHSPTPLAPFHATARR